MGTAWIDTFREAIPSELSYLNSENSYLSVFVSSKSCYLYRICTYRHLIHKLEALEKCPFLNCSDRIASQCITSNVHYSVEAKYYTLVCTWSPCSLFNWLIVLFIQFFTLRPKGWSSNTQSGSTLSLLNPQILFRADTCTQFQNVNQGSWGEP